MYINLFILASIGLFYGVVAKKIESTIISGPMIFVFLGLILGPAGLGIFEVDHGGELLSIIAEMTLALVLFTDASSAKFSVIKKSVLLPERLLLIGLPLTIVLGTGLCLLIFDNFSFIEAAILAIILAPTDAALGKPVITNVKVPEKIRESLNIESGLNDGICVPFLLLFMAFEESSLPGIPLFFVKAIGIGTIVGLGLTFICNFLIKFCSKKGWISKSWENIIIIALALSIFSLAQLLGGSGFIACFAGGLLFGVIAKEHKQVLIMSAEGIGELMAMITWTLFGSVAVGMIFLDLNLSIVIYALLSLTVIRMLPVFLSLSKSPINNPGKLFMGWFGPRGLASIVFVVMVLNEDLPHKNIIVITVTTTILLSVILHGISANPLVKWLSKET